MDRAIYGVRRRGIFDAIRLPKGFSAQETRNDLITQATQNGTLTQLPSALLQQPSANIYGNVEGLTIDGFIAYGIIGGQVGVGIGGLWNSGSSPIIVDKISFNTDGAVVSVGFVRSSDFLALDAETAADHWVSHKERPTKTRKDGNRRTGIFRSTEANYVAPAGAETPFGNWNGANTNYVPAYKNEGRDDLRIPPNSGIYMKCTVLVHINWEWREFNGEPWPPYTGLGVNIAA